VDILWTPWRYAYIKSGSDEKNDQQESCVFCSIQNNDGDDESKFILHRAEHNFIVLNIFPYISGHLLIVPYSHLGELDELPKTATDEMMELTKRSQTIIRDEYHPHGFNIGINIGRSAGAGVASHIHLHILPRWTGDANFMSTVGETRVLPEELSTTFERLRGHF